MEQTFQDKIVEAKKNNATRLSFGRNDGSQDWTEIPIEIFSLTHLEVLDLSNSKVKEIPKEIVKLTRLQKIEIKSNQIGMFPMILAELPLLKELTFTSNRLTQIPKELNNWEGLTYLNLWHCKKLKKINGMPPNVTYLNVGDTILTSLPDIVFKLKLSKLVLNKNNFQFPIELLEMQTLSALFITDMDVQPIINELYKLENLTQLWIDRGNVNNLPKSLFTLKKLHFLHLPGNNLVSLPDDFKKLDSLKTLEIGSNKFRELPKVIFELKNLESLSFGNLSSHLDGNKNVIKIIPDEILKLRALKSIDYYQNPIENIPEAILKEGLAAIRNYLLSKKEAEKEVFLYEAKMVMVGRGHVGKTVLTKKLTIPNYSLSKEKSTSGISVLKSPYLLKMSSLVDADSFKFNIWDFGGQEKYDATHQLFITNRSVYLFITEAREESNYLDFYYWLNTIQLFSNGSPVIIVLSKMDDRKKLLPETVYRDKFNNIIRFVDVSCANGYEHTIEALKSAIAEAVLTLPQTKDKLSNKWLDIRLELEELSKLHDFITYESYLEVCKKHKLDNIKADYLSLYLNDLGVIIHHQHDLLLKKTVFLNTDWCVDGLYAVLDNGLVFNNKGKFTNEDLAEIWKEDRFINKQPELLKLMQQYELCFNLKDHSGYIAPDLLPVDRSVDITWDQSANMQFEIRYDFMPAGILTRFIVKCHSFIKNKMYWKFGVVLEYDDTLAIVEEDYIHSKIVISLRGDNKKGLLSAIRMFIEEVHSDFDKANRLSFQEMVPCNCAECKMKPLPHFFKFSVLKKFEKLEKNTISCEHSGNDVKVKSLINDVQIVGYEDELHTSSDLQAFILKIISNVLEKEILSKEGYFNFWRDAKCSEPKNETEFQPYITNTIDRECKVRGVQVSREVREANGSVDVLFSYTNKEQRILKLCLEIKKAHHEHADTAISTQLPAYMDSAETSFGIYLVMWFKNSKFLHPSKYANKSKLLEQLSINNPISIDIVPYIINCSKKPSPSVIR